MGYHDFAKVAWVTPAAFPFLSKIPSRSRMLNYLDLRMCWFDRAAILTVVTLCDEVLLTVLLDRC